MLPNAEKAVIDSAKIRDYLLSPSHPVGRFKANVFATLGYTQEDWLLLRDAILELARSGNSQEGQLSPYGRKFEVSGMLSGPSGRSASFVTVWIVRVGEEIPRFVTAIPV